MRYITPTKRLVYEVSDLPGCTQVAVSHGMYMKPQFRGQGLSSEEGQHRLNHIHDLGYDYAICTVESTNERELQWLNKTGWKMLSGFISSKTGHTVYVYGRKTENTSLNPGE